MNNGEICYPFSEADRKSIEKLKSNPLKSHYSAKCYMGVWREGATSQDDFYSKTVLLKRNNCFFYPHQSDMMFKAAEVLQQRAQENKELKMSNMYTRIGLWIATGALLLNVVINW